MKNELEFWMCLTISVICIAFGTSICVTFIGVLFSTVALYLSLEDIGSHISK